MSLVKLATGSAPGILRKSIEQEPLRLHVEDAEAFPLSMCAEVCTRCQRKPATAMPPEESDLLVSFSS